VLTSLVAERQTSTQYLFYTYILHIIFLFIY